MTDLLNSGLSRGPISANGSDTSTIMGVSAGIHWVTGGNPSPWIGRVTRSRRAMEAGFARAFGNIFLLIIRSLTPRSYKKGTLFIDNPCTARAKN
jgi:hypothetical protein